MKKTIIISGVIILLAVSSVFFLTYFWGNEKDFSDHQSSISLFDLRPGRDLLYHVFNTSAASGLGTSRLQWFDYITRTSRTLWEREGDTVFTARANAQRQYVAMRYSPSVDQSIHFIHLETGEQFTTPEQGVQDFLWNEEGTAVLSLVSTETNRSLDEPYAADKLLLYQYRPTVKATEQIVPFQAIAQADRVGAGSRILSATEAQTVLLEERTGGSNPRLWEYSFADQKAKLLTDFSSIQGYQFVHVRQNLNDGTVLLSLAKDPATGDVPLGLYDIPTGQLTIVPESDRFSEAVVARDGADIIFSTWKTGEKPARLMRYRRESGNSETLREITEETTFSLFQDTQNTEFLLYSEGTKVRERVMATGEERIVSLPSGMDDLSHIQGWY